MGRGRVLLLTSCLGLGTVGLVAPAGASPLLGSSSNRYVSPTHRQVCAPAPARFSSCLAQVVLPGPSSGTSNGGGGAARGQTASPLSTTPNGLPPKAITTAYGFPTTGGAGKTIAIVDAYDDPTIASNLNTFSSQYGLPTCTTTNGCFTKVSQTGGTTFPRATSGWGLEISLDVEWAHALAPSAHILLVEATSNSDTNLFVAVTYASQHAQYVSMSWGGTEYTGEATFDADFTAAPSVSFFAASGDSGRRVVYPSASPDVISVGGTTLTVTKTTYAWKGETAWVKGGGGCSAFEPASAAQRAFPSYDQPGATCGGNRATPDVALDGNPSTGVSVYDTEQLSTGLQRWLKVGGTSASAVLWAARAAVSGAHITATYVYGDNIPYYEVVTAGQQCGAGYNLCSGVGSWNESHGSLDAALSFSTSPPTLTTGQASAAEAVDLSAPAPATGGLSVSLSTSSSGGGFSTSPTGPFAQTLTVSIPAGAASSGTFYYRDTKVGSPVVTASAPNMSPVSQTDTINVGPLARITVSPTTLNLTEGASQSLSATAVDQYTNPIPGFDPSWTATAGTGTFSPAQGASTTFTASSTVGTGVVTATQAGVHTTVPVTVSELSQPAAIVNSSTWMDVFYDNPSGNLMNAWWQSNSGWHDQVLATGMVGSPAAIVNSSTWMDVFYDSSSGNLMNEWWQSASGWHNQVLATGMVGSPTAVTRTATTMDVFYQSTSGQLMHASWTSKTGWKIAAALATGVAGAPVAVANSSTWMDVFYKSTSGQLMNEWWQSASGWHNQVLATGMAGAPAAVVNSSTWMDVFYQSTSGQLMNAWWQSASGWHDQALATGDNGTPTAIARTATSMDVFYQSTSGQLMNEWWNSKSGWHDQSLASGVAGAPAAIANSPTWMDVFYQSSAQKLVNAWWQSNSGWHVQTLF